MNFSLSYPSSKEERWRLPLPPLPSSFLHCRRSEQRRRRHVTSFSPYINAKKGKKGPRNDWSICVFSGREAYACKYIFFVVFGQKDWLIYLLSDIGVFNLPFNKSALSGDWKKNDLSNERTSHLILPKSLYLGRPLLFGHSDLKHMITTTCSPSW